MKSITIAFLLLAVISNVYSNKINPEIDYKRDEEFITISGTVTDAETGENLIGANIYNPSTLVGTVSNYYGFYSLKFPKGKFELQYSYVGYSSKTLFLNLNSDTVVNIELSPSIEIEEVVITDNSPRTSIRNTQTSIVELPVIKTKQLPVLLGEVDIIKSLQTMPGVQGGTEGSSGLYVRGGSPDQNLILLDGVPVYNVNHLFGFFSVFNADAIKNVTLYKGGFPARFGGRLSSVVDIRMKEGNMKEIKGEGSIGLLSSKLTVEGPIFKDKTSFIVSGRRSYFDILTYPVQIAVFKVIEDEDILFGYFLQDFNAKVNHKFSNRSRLYFSTYFGKDKFFLRDNYKYVDEYNNYSYSYKDKMGLKWGNRTAALRWNYIINNELFSNLTCTYSNFNLTFFLESYNESIESGKKQTDEYEYSYISEIEDIAIKYDFDYTPHTNHYIRFGFGNTFHLFTPGVYVAWDDPDEYYSGIDTTIGSKNIKGNEAYLYFEDEIKLGGRVKINAGIHYSNFLVQDKLFHSFEPRFSGRVMINDWLSFKASYVQMKQYLHLLAYSTFGLPNDLWVPATKNIPPQDARQIAGGFSFDINNNYEINIEGYYKSMDNLVEYGEGASFFTITDDWESLVTTGKGKSYGIEFFIRKTLGKTTGWAGYTLSKATRQFEDISYGKTFPFRYDRTHDITAVITHKFNENVDIGAVWAFGTGYPFTLADEKFTSILNIKSQPDNQYYWYMNGNNHINYFENRNSYRMPNYHRLDIGINFHKPRRLWDRTWSFGVYNVYMRRNPFMIYPGETYNEQTGEWESALKQVSFLPIVPYFKWGFKF